ncbi:MAG: 16S rRNA (cytosine(1402)-N(4))-methyltransferase RsmH [Phycisphaerae bacterium]|nr:16S rRNA (cytosine(1402)-N(4))-methyltransferase RsmH [Phycisphaerae bacterium]
MDEHTEHKPVLLDEVVELLRPVVESDNKIVLDCTLGLGGHASALLQASGMDAQYVGMDADVENVISAKRNLALFKQKGQVRFFHANFADVRDVLEEVGVEKVDAVLADLGFASNQMDDPQRGFSFMNDGPLDMRLDRDAPRTAMDIVNQVSEKELADLIYNFGDERFSRRIARAIVAQRKTKSIERTGELSEIIRSSMPAAVRRSRKGVHPATRTFQALRIAVNDELGVLDRLLDNLIDILNPGGRAGIISFHSLEDRRVKQKFSDLNAMNQAKVLTKKPITPTQREIDLNPRSRSAKLRGIEKL